MFELACPPMLCRLLPAIVLAVALTGCDSGPTPYENGSFEGTYTLPDGTTGTFQTRARAGFAPYVGPSLGLFRSADAQDGQYQFGTAHDDLRADPKRIFVEVGFAQPGLRPVPGAFSTQRDDPDRPFMGTSFSLYNVPGLNARDLLDPSTAIVSSPRGTVDVRVVGRTLSGTFDLRGQPFGVADSVEVRVVGRFETPYEPGKPSSQRR